MKLKIAFIVQFGEVKTEVHCSKYVSSQLLILYNAFLLTCFRYFGYFC